MDLINDELDFSRFLQFDLLMCPVKCTLNRFLNLFWFSLFLCEKVDLASLLLRVIEFKDVI